MKLNFILLLFLFMVGTTVQGIDYPEIQLPSEETSQSFMGLPSDVTLPTLRQAPDEEGNAQKEVASPLSMPSFLSTVISIFFVLYLRKRLSHNTKDHIYENI